MPYGCRYNRERDCIIAHGASSFLREKLFYLSDKYTTGVCKNCGLYANVNKEKDITMCKQCQSTEIRQTSMPYACKLLFQELMAMNIVPRMEIE